MTQRQYDHLTILYGDPKSHNLVQECLTIRTDSGWTLEHATEVCYQAAESDYPHTVKLWIHYSLFWVRDEALAS